MTLLYYCRTVFAIICQNLLGNFTHLFLHVSIFFSLLQQKN